MAKVIIQTDLLDPPLQIEVVEAEGYETPYIEGGWAIGWCPPCKIWLTDRGHFEDTCQEIASHLDTVHERN